MPGPWPAHLNDEDAQKRARLSQIRTRIWSHTLTVRVSEIVDDHEGSWNTASGILLRFRDRIVALTAWHVVERFVKIREGGGTPVLVIGNLPILEPSTIFIDGHNDIVLLEVPAGALGQLAAYPYDPSPRWPPVRVALEDPIMVCGFPALLRKNDEAEILFGDLSYFGSVESVSEHQFLIQLDHDDAIDAGRIPFPEPDADLGGMSGSPAFALYPDHIQLVGIFSQSATSAPVWLIRSLTHLPSDMDKRPSHRL